MRKYLKFTVYLACLAIATFGFTGCDNNDDPINEEDDSKSEALRPIVENYVNNIVIATYKNLADASIDVYEKVKALKADKTDENVKAAAEAWKLSREHWELSEAFLFGAVADFGIDPHIDTWPLDEEGFNRLMRSKELLESLDTEDGDLVAVSYFGESLLGFHGIEYILFENGSIKSASKITNDELIYAVAVAGDLRNQCIRLEAAWAGVDKVSSGKRQLIEDLELVISRSTKEDSYGKEMLNAGIEGKASGYPSVAAAASFILKYAFVIADEVGNIKIGTAANESASDEDKNYIESPYSFNSLKDFKDNIQSIENAYLGKAYGKEGPSISSYIAKVNPEADKAVRDAIAASYAAVEAIPFPFIQNYTSVEADKAVKVIGETLAKALTNANAVLFED